MITVDVQVIFAIVVRLHKPSSNHKRTSQDRGSIPLLSNMWGDSLMEKYVTVGAGCSGLHGRL